MSREEANPESDRYDDAPHPRETLALFGHDAAERELVDAYRRNKMAQAWIIGGPEGVGKATLAWRLARFLLAHPEPGAAAVQNAESLAVAGDHPAARRIASMALADIFLLRRAWNEKTKKHFTEIRIEDVRKVIQAFHQASGTGGWRIAIVDCADDLNRASANALLKLIEEPPERSLFLLVAHQPGRILPTIRSRCRKLMLAPLSPEDTIAAVRNLGPPWSEAPEADLLAAAARAEGSVREALRLLGDDGVAFDAAVRKLFDRLPQVDWLGAHMLADKLTWFANRVVLNLDDQRRHERIEPFQKLAVLRLTDSSERIVKIRDLSASGVSVEAVHIPAIGERVSIGKADAAVVRLFDGGFAVEFSTPFAPGSIDEATRL